MRQLCVQVPTTFRPTQGTHHRLGGRDLAMGIYTWGQYSKRTILQALALPETWAMNICMAGIYLNINLKLKPT
jgi:hypothetical protein